MTIADVLNRCELLDNELETGLSEDDETRALLALDTAQDYFETVAASFPKILGTSSTLATVANTETTAYPTTLMRLDSLWHLDDNSPARPTTRVERVFEIGGHAPSAAWPFRFAYGSASGDPQRYWTDENLIYWDPLPNAVYTKRVYGFFAKTNLTLRTQTFEYRDALALPFASFAVRVMSLGIGDDTDELQKLASDLFTPALRKLRKFSRERPGGRVYTRLHVT